MNLMKSLVLSTALVAGIAGQAMAETNVVIAIESSVRTLNPHNASITLDMSVAGAAYEGLFKFNTKMEIQPNLATGYEVSEDGKTYTITLNKGIKFHDGTDFNAEAVKYNFEHEIKHKLRRASLLTNVKEFNVLADDKLEVVLKEPSNNFINSITHPSQGMISPAALEKYGEDIQSNPVGTGRFVFDKWTRGSSVAFTANENYWRGPVKVDGIEFRTVAEAGSQLAMLQSGQAQFISTVAPAMKKVIDASPKAENVRVPTIIGRWYSLNTQNEIFSDVRVRKALNYAFNKEAFAKVVYNGDAAPMTSPIPSDLETYAEQESYKYDLEKAKALLAEAGYADGFKAVLWSKNSTLSLRSAEFMQQQLEALNIELEIIPRDTASHYAAGDTLKDDPTRPVIFDAGWSSSTGTADWALRPIYQTGAGSNYALYSNPELDKLIAEGQITLDPARKQEVYGQIQEIAWNDAPVIYTTVDYRTVGKSKALKGVDFLPDGSISVGDVELVK
ncbi:hypothetical protein E1162_17115 [Rhodobacteraceae bacterium RKSG542]|uniref:ABC transporter substrate-binding protein n=1 Tax=Pseudovibrio flavus TaxID=2529854 RepID=UPI0012BC867F|nr:ABC transporter substrate-binding protein [Pseudovibrio flavus]MTI18967.1 hypothetical protein [Pseudovibrio flavus]